MDHSLIFLALALPISLAAVVFSANFFVRGAVSIAHTLSLPEFLVGSVIVAIGTSAPEMAINVSAALDGAGDIVVSNIVGSNIVNVALGIGLAALIIPFDRARKEYIRTLLVGLLGAVALLANTFLVKQAPGIAYFSTIFGAVLFLAFSLFMYGTIKSANTNDEDEHEGDLALFPAILLIVAGAAAMAFFSDYAVGVAVEISTRMGIPEAVVGATVIAAGGSLPEVSSCIAAARIKRPNLILGNIAGSQIFNILGILGLSGLIRPFDYSTVLAVDIAILIGITIIVLGSILFAPLRRFMGPILVTSYVAYAGYLIASAI